MIKVTEFLTRKSGLSRAEFSHHWRFVHAPLVCGTPEIIRHNRRYAQAHALPQPVENTVCATQPDRLALLEYDGAVEVLCDDLETLGSIFAAPQFYEIIQPDEPNFIDIARSRVMIGELCEVWRAPASPAKPERAKLIVAIARTSAAERNDVFEAVLAEARRLSAGNTDSLGIVEVAATRTIDMPPGDVEAAHFDATLEIWFSAPARAFAFVDEPENLEAIFRPHAGLLDQAASGVFLASEIQIWPSR